MSTINRSGPNVRWISSAVTLLAAMLPGWAIAQVNADQEYAKFVSRAKTVTPMSEFGDQVSLRDGGVVFRATDLELKGTGPTIRVTRSYKPTGVNENFRDSSSNSFGGWELEIPRIKTITNNTTGMPPTSPTTLTAQWRATR